MAILIDGYNLLHVTRIFADATGPDSLQKLHAKFIQFLATALDPAEVAHTEVVFDAKGRHSGSRRMFRIGDLTVHYASRDEDADTYLAELIARHSTPRRLVVVSSDHQVQRAARRRRAKAIDSHVWYAELIKSRRQRDQRAQPGEDTKPPAPLSPDEVSRWLEVFTSDGALELSVPDSSPQIHQAQPIRQPTVIQRTKQESGSTEFARGHEGDPAGETPPEVSDEELFPASYLEAIERELLAEAPPKPQKAREGKRRPGK